MKEKVGFIGLGNIGEPMAENLVRKGFDIIVYDVRKEPLDALQKLGARVATSPKEVGEVSNFVIVMVRDRAQAEEVILAENGILAGAREGSIVIISSTLEPSFCQQVAKTAAAKGVGVIDAPVTGGMAGRAATGMLTLMVGGEQQLVDKSRPVLEAIGNNIFHIGGIGTGQIVKLANNMISLSSYLATTEAIALAVKGGVDFERLLEVIRTGSGSTYAAQGQTWISWYRLKSGTPDHLNITYKDANLALKVSKDLGLDLYHQEAVTALDITKILKNIPREKIGSEGDTKPKSH
ncbi:NAD(P)-dependent oxidoreductase [Chloroflexota bacterium]